MFVHQCVQQLECAESNLFCPASMDQKFVNNFCVTHNSDSFVIHVAASPMRTAKKFQKLSCSFGFLSNSDLCFVFRLLFLGSQKLAMHSANVSGQRHKQGREQLYTQLHIRTRTYYYVHFASCFVFHAMSFFGVHVVVVSFSSVQLCLISSVSGTLN